MLHRKHHFTPPNWRTIARRFVFQLRPIARNRLERRTTSPAFLKTGTEQRIGSRTACNAAAQKETWRTDEGVCRTKKKQSKAGRKHAGHHVDASPAGQGPSKEQPATAFARMVYRRH
jgi:hypothetical protein